MIGKRLFQVQRILITDPAFCAKTITTIFEFGKFTCTVHPLGLNAKSEHLSLNSFLRESMCR